MRSLPALSGERPEFAVAEAADKPVDQFGDWLEGAIKAGVPEPHAMTLSTVDAQGRPDARVLLLKDLNEEGWYFAANSSSPKGRQIALNAEVALSFHWPTVCRQVRIRGRAIQLEAERGAEDFLARSLGSRATALVGHQSEEMRNPTELAAQFETNLAAVTALPTLVEEDWAVYVVSARYVEFWQGSADRRHHRLRYRLGPSGWGRAVLWP